MLPLFQMVQRHHSCQLPTDFHNISIAQGVWAPGVGSPRTIYGTQWCASTTQFAYRKGLGTCDALLCVSHTLQSALESGQEARSVQIDFSAAFDRVNHQGFLSVGIAGSVLPILTQFKSNRSQHVMVNGSRSKEVNVVTG